MLQIRATDLPEAEQRYLAKKQREIDQLVGFNARVDRAEKSWDNKSDARFSVIRGRSIR